MERPGGRLPDAAIIVGHAASKRNQASALRGVSPRTGSGSGAEPLRVGGFLRPARVEDSQGREDREQGRGDGGAEGGGDSPGGRRRRHHEEESGESGEP